jgi:mono/diheme cytochrome c family protein
MTCDMIHPERVEVYVDDATAPAQVLSGPPFHINLDTTALPDGGHTVRVVTRFPDGRSAEQRIGIVVSNQGARPEVLVEGLADGDLVAGVVRATVTVQPPPGRLQRARASLVLYPIVAAVAVVGAWAMFALPGPSLPSSGTGAGTGTAASPAPASTGGATVSRTSAAAGSPGATQFQFQGCVGCHMVNGQGGTVGMDLTHIGAKLSRARMRVVITQGEGQMPAYAKLKPADLNALLDYLQSLK